MCKGVDEGYRGKECILREGRGGVEEAQDHAVQVSRRISLEE